MSVISALLSFDRPEFLIKRCNLDSAPFGLRNIACLRQLEPNHQNLFRSPISLRVINFPLADHVIRFVEESRRLQPSNLFLIESNRYLLGKRPQWSVEHDFFTNKIFT